MMRSILFIPLVSLLLGSTSCQGSSTSPLSREQAPAVPEETTKSLVSDTIESLPVEETPDPIADPVPSAAGQPAIPPAPPARTQKKASPPVQPVENKAETDGTETPEATPAQPETPPVETGNVEPVQPPAQPQAETTEAGPPSHDAWDKLLQQYVGPDGKVNYQGFKKDKTKLEAYLHTLETNPPQDNWPRAEKMAFWINAYNAATVKLIVDHYPLTSITKLDGGKTWDVKRVKIGNQSYSLNQIENEILRPRFKDPRIHFAVNCAALSCPPLLNQAWTAARLENQFEQQAKAFINDPRFNTIGTKAVKVSRIFEWYAADFGNLIDYLNRYSTTRISSNAKVTYLEYDWGLNGN